MAKNIPGLAPAALSLFDVTTQQAIIRYCRTTPEGSISADLDRGNPYLPPGIFALASPKYALSEENAYYVLMGLTYSALANVKDTEYGKAYYQALFEDLFGADAAYAGQLADRVETTDKASGTMGSVWSWMQEAWNSQMPDRFGLDANVGDQVKDDIDLSFEMLQLGKELTNLLLRQAMMINRVTNATSPDAYPQLQKLLATMNRSGQQGDIVGTGDLRRAVRRVSPPPLPLQELGPVGNLFSSIGNAASNFFRSPAGQAAVTAAASNVAGRLTQHLTGGGQQAAPPPAHPTNPGAPPIQVTADAITAAGGSGRSNVGHGNAVVVQLR